MTECSILCLTIKPMKAIVVTFDSLNRHFLPPYGCDWVQAPNFTRLAQRSARFDTSYVCSMPCMPARRDFLTGRPNFLHRSWGPIEPFDDAFPEMLHAQGVYSHLVTDHQHYFEDGGATYHNRYSSWEFIRGQEGDPWIGQVEDPLWPPAAGRNAKHDRLVRHDLVNRQVMRTAADWPQTRTFDGGLDFLKRNHQADRWLLQIETFDPHEPFFSPPEAKAPYAEHFKNYSGKLFDWPAYAAATEPAELREHCRMEYAALVSYCDGQLGRVLDAMDEYGLWDDTMLIVWTDHGFLLGEHGCWAKMHVPWYEELARTPFFAWDPRCRAQGVARRSLVQPAIDLAPTLLDFFGVPPTPSMTGFNLGRVISHDEPVRQYGLFGTWGAHVNITTGRHVYMRATTDPSVPLYEYTLMPARMRRMFSPAELAPGRVELAGPLPFTKGMPVLRIAQAQEAIDGIVPSAVAVGSRHLLFDLAKDSGQQNPIDDPVLESRMAQALAEGMRQAHAPQEQFARLGLAGI